MNRKTLTLLTAAWLGLALAGPPTAAAAPVMDFGKANPTFVSTAGASLLTLGPLNVACTSVSSTGRWTTEGASNKGTTGTVQLVFKGCTHTGSFPCTTPGAATGEIKSEELVFHLIYIKGFSTTVGMLITNNATTGRFAVTSCGNITGNGLIAHLGSPKCGETKATMTMAFESLGAGVPRYQEIEGSGTKYRWMYGEKEASADMLLTTTLEPGASATLTCL